MKSFIFKKSNRDCGNNLKIILWGGKCVVLFGWVKMMEAYSAYISRWTLPAFSSCSSYCLVFFPCLYHLHPALITPQTIFLQFDLQWFFSSNLNTWCITFCIIHKPQNNPVYKKLTDKLKKGALASTNLSRIRQRTWMSDDKVPKQIINQEA